ncbi:MAG: hypothetical protein QM667_00570 [Asticcacaulis sp.]
MTERLTPEARRSRLRAYADHLLIALSEGDPPKTGEDVENGLRRALMIERLYARADASEAVALRRAASVLSDQVTLQNRQEWATRRLGYSPDIAFVSPIAEVKQAPATPPAPKVVPAEKKHQATRATTVLTPAENALRQRVMTTTAIPRPDHALPMGHDYGLILNEDVEIVYADVLEALYAKGCTRDELALTLKRLSRQELNALWPDLFPLDTS